MTMSISLPVKRQAEEFLRLFGPVKRRMQLEEVVVEHSTPDLGFDFGRLLPEFHPLRSLLLPEEAHLAECLSAAELALLKLVERSAHESGFAVAVEMPGTRLLGEGERIVPLIIEPHKGFQEMLAASFDERGALGRPRDASIQMPEAFGEQNEEALVPVRKGE